MKTFFALVNIPSAQLKGSKVKTHKTIEPTKASPWANPPQKPLYETEHAVTSAIANGTFQGQSARAYTDAKTWQEYQKYLAWVASGCPKRQGGKAIDSTVCHNRSYQFPSKHRLSY